MFKLFKLNEDRFLIIKDNGVTIEGSRVKIIRALMLMDVTSDEIFEGIRVLEHGDDMADYGVNLTFTFSKKFAA